MVKVFHRTGAVSDICRMQPMSLLPRLFVVGHFTAWEHSWERLRNQTAFWCVFHQHLESYKFWIMLMNLKEGNRFVSTGVDYIVLCTLTAWTPFSTWVRLWVCWVIYMTCLPINNSPEQNYVSIQCTQSTFFALYSSLAQSFTDQPTGNIWALKDFCNPGL